MFITVLNALLCLPSGVSGNAPDMLARTPDEILRSIAPLASVERRAGAVKPEVVLTEFLTQGAGGLATPAVYAVELDAVVRRYAEFTAALPRVMPYYAVKCNPDAVVVRVLAELGAGFDCASMDEIQLVREAGRVGDKEMSQRIVYANPCKQVEHLRYAKKVGIDLMTFDSEDELLKIQSIHSRARLLLRIATADFSSLCPLSSKYGASMTEVEGLLRAAHSLGLNIVGVAFHVGSGCVEVHSYVDALERVRKVFDLATFLGLPPLSIVDIGGGFPGYDGESAITFDDIAMDVGAKLDNLFDVSVRVIAEPGRFFVSSAFTLGTQVLSRRSDHGKELDSVVIGDGVYGSFKDAILLNVQFFPHRLLLPTSSLSGAEDSSGSLCEGGHENPGACEELVTLYGPTGDGRDVIGRNVPLAASAQPGDWLYFLNMGAYTLSLATGFNSISLPYLHYYIGDW